MMTAQATEGARLKRKLEVAEDDLTLINKRLVVAQGMFLGQSVYVSMII
jgi:hypothetical protein